MSATTRTCGNCERPMGRGDIRQRDPRTGKVVCSLCLAHPVTQPNKIDVTATREEHDRMDPRKPFPGLRALAHDGGDGQVVYHCAFCGSGGVVARSDGSVECTVCQQYFTIQVQPRHPNSPQTVNGQPVHIPGMPEESEVTPATGGNNVPVPLDQQDKVVPGFSDAEMEEEIPGAQAFRTASGAVLDRTAYVQHLALGVTSDPARTLAQIRQANARPR